MHVTITGVLPTADAVSGGGPSGRKRGRPRDVGADARILAAATDLILERGFDATTVDEVALRAQVGKATVYRRWARKEDLAVAAMQALYSRELEQPDTGTLRGDLMASYSAVVAFSSSPVGRAYLRTTIAESIRDPRISALYREAQIRASQHAYRMFERAQARGEIRPGQNLRWAVDWLGGVLAAAVIIDQPLPTDDEVEQLVDFVLRGVSG